MPDINIQIEYCLDGDMAIEFAPANIRVNAIAPAIAPAVVETPLFDLLPTSEQLESFNSFGSFPTRKSFQSQNMKLFLYKPLAMRVEDWLLPA